MPTMFCAGLTPHCHHLPRLLPSHRKLSGRQTQRNRQQPHSVLVSMEPLAVNGSNTAAAPQTGGTQPTYITPAALPGRLHT